MLNFVAGRQTEAEIIGLRAPHDPLSKPRFYTPSAPPTGCKPAPTSPTF